MDLFANDRYDIILQILNEQRSVTVSELTERFGVSIETVRRDLEYLEKQQKLQRVHGGAISKNRKNTFDVIEKRLLEHFEQKKQLSEIAMRYIDDGDVIAVDSGSTAVAFAMSLKKSEKKVTVITYSSEVFQILSESSNVKLILTGGLYLPAEKAFYGSLAAECLKKIHADKCFLFPSAVSLKYGAGDFIYEIVDLQKMMMEQANNVFILADSSKLETTANLQITGKLCGCTLITDSDMSNALYDLYIKNNIDIIKE